MLLCSVCALLAGLRCLAIGKDAPHQRAPAMHRASSCHTAAAHVPQTQAT